MKAITLWQPWASLMALKHKAIETRCWTTKYRGPLAIHSAKNLPAKWLGRSAQTEPFRDALADIFNVRRDCDERSGRHVDDVMKSLPRGRVLCIVELVDILETSDIYIQETLTDLERLFGNYDDGRYAWKTRLIELLDEPIPAIGHQRIWEWKP